MKAEIVNQDHNDNTADSSVLDVEFADILARATPGHRVEVAIQDHVLAVVIGRVDVENQSKPGDIPRFCTSYHLPEYSVDGHPVTREDFVVISEMLGAR